MKADDPRHGTYGGYWQHRHGGESPCYQCRVAASRYNVQRQRQIAYGRWNPWVPAEPVRQHVEHLRDAGMSIASIAKAAGVRVERISHLLYGAGKRRPPAQVRPDYAGQVLAVSLVPNRVGPHGVARRLQALMALGHSGAVMAERLGVSPSRVDQLINGDVPVMRSTHERVCVLYEELSMAIPADVTGTERRRVGRARTAARKRGWAPPLAWGDSDIDDPDGQPMGIRRGYEEPATDVDPTVVARILDGDWRMPCTPAEKTEVARRWHATERPLNELARLTGWRIERYFTACEARRVGDEAGAA